MREEGIVLEHRVDVAAIGRHALGGLAEDLDMAVGRLLETGHQAQAGGLAGAGGAEHGEELAGRDLQIDRIDGADLAEMARYVLETNGGHGRLRGMQRSTAIFQSRSLCLERGRSAGDRVGL